MISSAGVKRKITQTIRLDLGLVVLVLVDELVDSGHEGIWNKVNRIRKIK